MKGMSSRRMLDWNSGVGMLEDGQDDVIMDTLREMFPPSKKNAFSMVDYFTRVMIPECIFHISQQQEMEACQHGGLASGEEDQLDSSENEWQPSPKQEMEACQHGGLASGEEDQLDSSENEWQPSPKKRRGEYASSKEG
ncbi:uncharacterized protein [Littorina saxatilis]